jgi:hypothetical protein
MARPNFNSLLDFEESKLEASKITPKDYARPGRSTTPLEQGKRSKSTKDRELSERAKPSSERHAEDTSASEEE